MNSILAFTALLTVAAAANVAVYNAVPEWNTHSTVVKSDRVGGNFAYSVKQNPAVVTYAATAPVHWNSAWNGQQWNAAAVPVVKSAWTGHTPANTWNTNWNTASVPVVQTNSAWTGTPSNTWTTNWNTASVPAAQTKSAGTWTGTPANTWNTNWNTASVPATQTRSAWTGTPSHTWNTNWNTASVPVVQTKSAWTGETPASTHQTSSVVVPGWNSWNTYASAWPVNTWGYQVVQ